MNSLVIKMEQIEHFSHNHPLFLRDEKKNDEDECCSACTLPISGSSPSYGCSQCKEFVLHRACAELPRQIHHSFHQWHSLTLLHKICHARGYICDACRKTWSVGFVYHCAACNFDLDIGCALLSPTIKYEGHGHLLALFEKIYDDNYLCDSCGTTFEASSVLRCVVCDFNCHKSSCSDKSYIQLPQQIDHPFHPLHPLTFANHVGEARCHSCCAWLPYFSLQCESCRFRMCVECISLAPTIKYENHDHLLTFFEKIDGTYNPICKSCRYIIREDFLFRCVQCSFDIHTKCIPWLTTIKHECHIHPLTLADGRVGDEGSGKFYCDACETERDPSYSVYYCSECNFVAHIKCVIFEVVPQLIAEQESDAKAKKEEEIKPAFIVKDGIGITEDPAPMKREEKIEKLRMEVLPPLIAEQESDATAKKEEIKPAAIGKDFLHANTVGEVKPRGDQAIVSSEEDGIGITEDPALLKLEEKIEKLRMEVIEQKEKLQALTIELDELEDEHALYVESKMARLRH